MIRNSCGPAKGHISIAGSFTVEPIALMWSELYKLGCPLSVELVGGGSSVGAGRVCADSEKGEAVDIGNMCRGWKKGLEADERDGFIYDCLKGSQKRSAIQVDIALDGITGILPRKGTAYDCLQILGGLSIDQLRWIYSNYSDTELLETGWDALSLKNSDNDPATHLWSGSLRQ